jgi:hypothetical protein
VRRVLLGSNGSFPLTSPFPLVLSYDEQFNSSTEHVPHQIIKSIANSK